MRGFILSLGPSIGVLGMLAWMWLVHASRASARRLVPLRVERRQWR